MRQPSHNDIANLTAGPLALSQPAADELLAMLRGGQAGGLLLAEDRPPARLARVGSVAVIPLHGILTQRSRAWGTPCEEISALLRAALADSAVKTVVFDVSSPGGSTFGVGELAAEVRAARTRKRVVAAVNSVADSAAYWAVSGASEIVVTPGGETGSIGVFTLHRHLDGTGVSIIHAGKYKVEEHPYAPLSDTARAALQARVDEAYLRFTGDVGLGRRTTRDRVVTGFGEGRSLPAEAAVAAGLADRVAPFSEVLAWEQRDGHALPAAAFRRERLALERAWLEGEAARR